MVEVHARCGGVRASEPGQQEDAAAWEDILSSAAGSHEEAMSFFYGLLFLLGLVAVLVYSPTLMPLVYLAFTATALPHRIVSFHRRKWTFYLVDFCYFANLACCAFFLAAPEHARAEAALWALCEGPLAAALVAWRCAWVLGSPGHVISVLIHLLPGLALFCHRHLAHTRRPMQLAAQLAAAALGGPGPGLRAQRVGAGLGSAAGGVRWGGGGGWERVWARAAAVDAVARGCVGAAEAGAAAAALAEGAAAAAVVTATSAAACAAVGLGGGPAAAWDPAAAAAAAAVAAAAAGSGGCYSSGDGCCLRPAASASAYPAPAWLWLGAAPLGFYAAWQLLYFLVVQVAFRRLILAGGYDTSYSALARRAQRSAHPLNRIVRSGGTARRLTVYGLLQLLFTLAAQALAVASYHSMALAVVCQAVKLLLPLYLGAAHQCQRLPELQLRAAVERARARGLLGTDVQPRQQLAAAAQGEPGTCDDQVVKG